jgi:hypothetical protein
MTPTLIIGYVIGVIIMALFSLLVIFNFVRYRFKGDLTFFFISLFFAGFIIITVGSLLLTKPENTLAQPLEQQFR